jgi:hypothetical protein
MLETVLGAGHLSRTVVQARTLDQGDDSGGRRCDGRHTFWVASVRLVNGLDRR